MEKELIEFIITSKKKGYAAGESVIQKEEDKSYSTRVTDGDFSFHDNWFGGEPFGGREIVMFKGDPYWMMVYYGHDNGEAVGLIDFLRKALSQIPDNLPVRGPKLLKEGDFRYENNVDGNIEKFIGVEKIFYKNKEVFKTSYAGGLVDRRKDQ